jgi:hypothetical protein
MLTNRTPAAALTFLSAFLGAAAFHHIRWLT